MSCRPIAVALALLFAQAVPAPANSQSGAATLDVPRDTFTVVARLAGRTHAAPGSLAVYGAEAWVRDDRGEIGRVGTLSAAQTTGLARQLVAPVVVVIGRYAVDAAELAVDVYRLERSSDDQIVVERSAFVPAHGNRWAVARKYLTASEAASDPLRPGRNPFARFDAGTDPLFHGIDIAAAETAVAHAMTYFHAHYGVFARVQLFVDVTQTHSGGWLRRTYTTTEHVIAQTTWRVAAPVPVQPWASIPAFCVVDATCTDGTCSARRCPDPALVASAGMPFDDWTGPSLPMADQEIASVTSSSRGWTVLGLGAITDLLAPGLGAAEGGLSLATNGGAPLQLQAAPLATPDDGVATSSLAPGTPIAQVAATPLQQGVFGSDAQRLSGIQAGYARAVVTPGSYDRDRAGNEMLDAVRQYQLCRQRGLAGEALRRCAAPSLQR